MAKPAKKKSQRRSARESALQMLYQIDSTRCSADQALATFWSSLAESRAGADYAEHLVRGFDTQKTLVDERISSAADHWRIDRMARVDRNILRLATLELIEGEVPTPAVIDEAVELARTYGAEGSVRFVNGVLDRISRDMRKR